MRQRDPAVSDISSDPVDRHVLAHPTPHYDCPRCLPISSHSVLRDISSVTGSLIGDEAKALLDLFYGASGKGKITDRYEFAARLVRIEREAVEPLERKNAELRSALRWVRSHLRYDPPIIRDPEEVARVIDRALLEGKTDE